MSTDYSEKRNYFRMSMDCGMEYSINGSGEKQCGKVKDLSGDGVSFFTDQAIPAGTEIEVLIKPESDVTPALEVTVEVLRCEQNDSQTYEVAGNITKR